MTKGNRNLPQPKGNNPPVPQVTTASFSGPLPPPALLQGYEAIKTGFADRIVKMAESESDHRRKQEEKALNSDIKASDKEFLERRIGQFLAFAIVIIMASLGFYLAITGRELAGSIFGGPAIVSIVGAFLYRKKEKNSH